MAATTGSTKSAHAAWAHEHSHRERLRALADDMAEVLDRGINDPYRHAEYAANYAAVVNAAGGVLAASE